MFGEQSCLLPHMHAPPFYVPVLIRVTSQEALIIEKADGTNLAVFDTVDSEVQITGKIIGTNTNSSGLGTLSLTHTYVDLADTNQANDMTMYVANTANSDESFRTLSVSAISTDAFDISNVHPYTGLNPFIAQASVGGTGTVVGAEAMTAYVSTLTASSLTNATGLRTNIYTGEFGSSGGITNAYGIRHEHDNTNGVAITNYFGEWFKNPDTAAATNVFAFKFDSEFITTNGVNVQTPSGDKFLAISDSAAGDWVLKAGDTMTGGLTITADDTEALLIEAAGGNDFAVFNTTDGVFNMPLQGVDAGTDILRVNKVLKRVGIFTSTLSNSTALLQIGQASALLNAVQSNFASFGSGQSYVTLKNTVSGLEEMLFGVDSSGGLISVFSDDILQLRWGDGVGAGNKNYATGLRGGELAMTSISQGIAWYNTADVTTNYEKVAIDWASNVLNIFTTAGGTGTVRDIKLGSSTNYFEFDVSDGAFRTEGGVRVKTTRVTASTHTITYAMHTIYYDTDSNAISATLPAGVDGQTYKVVNCGSSGNNLTITPNGSELLQGANSSQIFTDGESIMLTYQTTEGWWVF